MNSISLKKLTTTKYTNNQTLLHLDAIFSKEWEPSPNHIFDICKCKMYCHRYKAIIIHL